MSTDSYSQHAASWTNKKSSGKHLAHDALEKPAILSLVGDVMELSILCLGCGSGEECWDFVDHGAQHVRGIDISRGLIANARYLRHDENASRKLSFEVGDIGKMSFDDDQTTKYDLVFSSLTFHYIEEWQSMLHQIKRVLKPGGRLIFSTHHPIKWGSQTSRTKEYNQFLLGYQKNKTDSSYQIYGDYLTTRKVRDTLFGQMEIEYYNRSLSTIFAELKAAGFAVTTLVEPVPDSTNTQLPQDFVEVYSKIPLFVLFEATAVISSQDDS